jgi:hypothetical protein
VCKPNTRKRAVEPRKRAAGIEPASSAWKAEVLPLNYARKRTHNLAGSGGRHRLRPIQPAKIIHQSGYFDQDRRSQQLITPTTGVHRFDEIKSSQVKSIKRIKPISAFNRSR